MFNPIIPNTPLPELLQKITSFLNYIYAWFNQYILSGLASFLKGLGELIIKILEFFIDIIRWLISYF